MAVVAVAVAALAVTTVLRKADTSYIIGVAVVAVVQEYLAKVLMGQAARPVWAAVAVAVVAVVPERILTEVLAVFMVAVVAVAALW